MPKPWSVQIELTEGCNRRCSFCGIHSLYRTKSESGYRYMTPETAKKIADQLAGWLPKIRIEFALQGEPLLNRDHLEIFRIFRSRFPKCQMMCTTNTDPLRMGDGFDKEHVRNLFSNGLNILVADYYGEKTDMPYAQFREKMAEAVLPFKTSEFYENHPAIWQYVGYDVQYAVTIDNTVDRNTYRKLNNQAGNTDPDLIKIDGYKVGKLPLDKRCPLPFRELVIRHDGAVPICCMDWQREAIMGHMDEKTLPDIWNGSVMNHARNILHDGNRASLQPCDRCNYIGHRVGLIERPFSRDMTPSIVESEMAVKKAQRPEWQGKYAGQPFDYSEVTE